LARSQRPTGLRQGRTPGDHRRSNGHMAATREHPSGLAGDGDIDQLARIGWRGLLLLAFLLPFELTQRPLLSSTPATLTNLKVVLYIVDGLAVAYLVRHASRAPRASLWAALAPVRLPLVLLASFLMCSLASSLLSSQRGNSLKWTLDALLGGVLWVVMPLWIADNRMRKLKLLAAAILLGASTASVAGILEFSLGSGYAAALRWFKPKPTLAGSFLRLSGTFEYANIAAMYFELALPLAFAGLVEAAIQRITRWKTLVAWLAAALIVLEGTVLTFSRGAVLGLAASTVTAIALAYRNRGRISLGGRGRAAIAAFAVLGALATALTVANTPLAFLRFTSASDQQWYLASYNSNVPAVMGTCQRTSLQVIVLNRSPFMWEPSGNDEYHLGYHWLYPSGKVARFENQRSALPAPVAPGRSQSVEARIIAPAKAGSYVLVWDMVQENVTWFSLKSADFVGRPVRVTGRSAATQICQDPASRRTQGELSGPSELPRTLSQPARSQLWADALRMLRTHPILGVGPDGYRFEYGAYAIPPLKSWDRKILANELYLEQLADLGLLGGGLYVAFLAAIWWPLIEGLARRHQGRRQPLRQ
jgi:hypothetical protein